jgi:mono/diheme cytochrome c family protein
MKPTRIAFSRLAMVMAAAVAAVAAMGPGAPLRAQDKPGGGTSVQAADEGQQLYEQICQACHMADAKGGGGVGTGVPALAGNAHLASKAFAVTTVYGGRGGMPRFAEMLTPAQIAAVLTYVRGHFNAYPDPISEAEVKKLATAPQTQNACNACTH